MALLEDEEFNAELYLRAICEGNVWQNMARDARGFAIRLIGTLKSTSGHRGGGMADGGAAGVQVLPSTCRAMVGQVAGGGRTEKPLLKAGNAYHKFRVKRNSWPKVPLLGCPQRSSVGLVPTDELLAPDT